MPLIRYGQIAFPLPPGWEDGTQVVALAPPVEGFRANIVLSMDDLDEDDTLETFARRSLTRIQEIFRGADLIDERLVALGDFSTYRREYRLLAATGEGAGKVIRQLQFFIMVGAKMYTFTFTDLENRFELTKNIVEKVVSQLRVTRAKDDLDQLGVEARLGVGL